MKDINILILVFSPLVIGIIVPIILIRKIRTNQSNDTSNFWKSDFFKQFKNNNYSMLRSIMEFENIFDLNKKFIFKNDNDKLIAILTNDNIQKVMRLEYNSKEYQLTYRGQDETLSSPSHQEAYTVLFCEHSQKYEIMISITTAGFQFKYENQLIEIEKTPKNNCLDCRCNGEIIGRIITRYPTILVVQDDFDELLKCILLSLCAYRKI